MSDALKKFLIIALLALILFPLIPRLLPKPASFERAKAAFEEAGFTVSDYQVLPHPQMEAGAQASMKIESAFLHIYRYDSEGKIRKHMEYQKKDAGTAIVESWNLAQSLGAAPKKQIPSIAVRNGKYMLIAHGQDKALLDKIGELFRKL